MLKNRSPDDIVVTELGVKKTRNLDVEDSVISESLEKCVKLFCSLSVKTKRMLKYNASTEK
ncbi:hypothetical protein [Methanococcoides burtonii]|uniref:hypothetical protein n=1 Tax=Methanococcoides burtonii TaxID=29291 RepID=UPI0000398E4F|nr:hypothetical protein [Methanococcoides burtonii]